jgi:ClpP class serine protease
MAGWDEILTEFGTTPSQTDSVRRKYLASLSEYTGRNIIAYYSSWLTKRSANNLEINDSDMEGFMNAVKDIDCKKGLDLLLHTPGGDPNAAEAIVSYLKDKFNKDIRVIVPHMAMSAGTMIACSGKEIIMGKQSSMGPIDPQFQGIPAHNIIEEYNEAKSDLASNPQNAQYWAIKLQQYPAAFMKTAADAISLSEELLKSWLEDCMFETNEDREKIITRISKQLNDHSESKSHSRHFNYKKCQDMGLVIKMMEEDQGLQNHILTVHHSFMITLDNTDVVKIIENHKGKAYINHQRGK